MEDWAVWDTTREWSARWIRWLKDAVVSDWREERVSRDFFDKMQVRRFTRQQVWTAITSSESYIGRYWYDSNRVGFWHPRSRLFIAWKPNALYSPSRIMSGFYHSDGVAYMQKFTPFREIRGPKRK